MDKDCLCVAWVVEYQMINGQLEHCVLVITQLRVGDNL